MNLAESLIPLFEEISLMEKERRDHILSSQGIESFYYHCLGEVELAPVYKAQKQKNLIHFEMAKFVHDELAAKNIPHAFIKGIALLDDIYKDWGLRFMSDVDLYIPEPFFREAISILRGLGLRDNNLTKWRGDSHKKELYYDSALGELTLEVHAKVFWHRPDLEVDFIDDSKELPCFGLENHFVFLCGHFVFQHSAQKLYWLVDIYLFLKKHEKQMNWSRIQTLCEYYGFKKSLSFVNQALCEFFNFQSDIPYSYQGLPIPRDFMFSDNQRHWFYLYVKNFMKDSNWDTVLYNTLWLQSRLRKG